MHIELDFSANVNCLDILLEVWIDDNKIFQSVAQQQVQTVIHNVSEEAADHELKLIMSGKNSTHTKLDKSGQIVSDIFFNIDRLEFEDLDMYSTFCLGLRSRYRHSFNSPGPEFDDEFYGAIGCNGTVVIPFSTPIFLWLANNLD